MNQNAAKTFFSVFIVIVCTGCSETGNFENAYGYFNNGQAYLKLKGQRGLLPHDISSIGKKYKDSIEFQLPSLENGIIDGNRIPARKGYYNYQGIISIKGNDVVVNLLYFNTDDKTIDPLSWNGKYKLIKEVR